MESKGPQVLVLKEVVQVRRQDESKSRPVIRVRDDDFAHLPGGIILADAFRDCIRVILREAFVTPEVQELTTSQLLCDLIRFAAGWAHSFWREHYPVAKDQETDHHQLAWRVLRQYVANPLRYCPEGQPVRSDLTVRQNEMELQIYPSVDDFWKIIRKGSTGNVTIRYDD